MKMLQLREDLLSPIVFLLVYRLKRIIEIVWNVVHQQPLNVAEFSRMVSDRERPRILQQFKDGKINLFVSCVLHCAVNDV